ncbi:MAG: hypothetical protein OEV44_05460 [Spirochaetota bacterium]|nr:hypothetical protein [Spirochaetota bacterium]
MKSTFLIYIEAQVNEIQKYKWIESEKACRDLGQQAVKDWIIKYSPDFREKWEQNYGPLCD